MYESVGVKGGRAAGAGLVGRSEAHDAQCDMVIALVAQQKHIAIRLLMHKSRCRVQTARARQLAMYLCHVCLGRSLQAVGEVFGRDRTTVSYACGLIEDMRDIRAFDEEVAALELDIEAAIGGQHGPH